VSCDVCVCDVITQSVASQLTSCRNDARRLQSDAESMTSRTGHVMATAAMQPIEERLRQAAQLAACAGRNDLVDGHATTTTNAPSTAAVTDAEVIR